MLESTLRPPSTTAAAVSSHEVSMPRTIITYSLARQLGDGYQAQPASLPARHVLLEQPHGQGMAVGHHDHLSPPLGPSRHLVPAGAVADLSAGVIHQDLPPSRSHPHVLRLLEGHRLARRVRIHQ